MKCGEICTRINYSEGGIGEVIVDDGCEIESTAMTKSGQIQALRQSDSVSFEPPSAAVSDRVDEEYGKSRRR